jgi:hypothetical protein
VSCCRAFLAPPCSPLSSWDTLFAIGYFYIYASDVLLNFCVAYYSEEGELVTDLRSIASEHQGTPAMPVAVLAAEVSQ